MESFKGNINQLSKVEKYENEKEEDTPAELSEVDLGTKDETNFDELISFSHTYLNYRIAKTYSTLKELDNNIFGLLMSNEFLLAGSNITVDSLNSMSNSEIVKTLKNKTKSYNSFDYSQKITFVENIPFYIKQIGLEETIDLILPIILNIYKERTDVLERFLNVFNNFVDEINKFGNEGYIILRDKIIDILSLIFQNRKEDNILELNSKSLVYLTRFIKEEDRGPKILTIVIMMAHDDDNERIRVLSTKIFNDLALIIGKELLELYVVAQVASFAEDQASNVRKAITGNLLNICKGVSKNCFINRLLPVYQKLSKDSLWTIRKVAVSILPELTKLCDNDTISKVLLDIFKDFSQDSKSFVRNSTLEIFGQFISLLDKNDIKKYNELLDFYINTINEFDNSKKKEDKIILQKCAFNFPAVLMTYGNENWDKLKLCFIKMTEQKDENIILPLASSLGEIAKILGPELTESDLLEFVDKFYKYSGEIKMKILSILPDIIRNISSNKKNQYLENIKIMIGNRDDKWRKRLNYSKIIGKFNNTYSDSIIYKRVFPIAINFCFDDVNQVRIKSAGHNSRIILQLISGDTEYKDKTLKIIQSFARSINYSYRQLFILMCKHIFEKKDVWEKDISPLLVDLAYDKIINVRISLAKFIYKVINKNKYDYLKNDNTIKKIYSILKKEDNNEISSIINLLNIETVNVDLNINVNDKFTDNMSFVSNEFGITRNVPLESKIKSNINAISPSSNLVDEKDKLEEGSPIPIEENKKDKDKNKNEEDKSVEDKKE
jgi:serine/threonine-protein phosphatase 4 regulatory subunit 1